VEGKAIVRHPTERSKPYAIGLIVFRRRRTKRLLLSNNKLKGIGRK
jgi:hypothetical protein